MVGLSLKTLGDTARYAGLLLAPAEGFNLWPRTSFALWAKQKPNFSVLANFRPFLVSSSNLVCFSSKLKNYKKNPNVQKKFKIIPKKQFKKSKN